MLAAVALAVVLAAGPSKGLPAPELAALLMEVAEHYAESNESNAPEAHARALGLGDLAVEQAGAYRKDLTSIRSLMLAGAQPYRVEQACSALMERIIRDHQIATAPNHLPDLYRGQALFGKLCEACHGDNGAGNTALSHTLNPSPPSFLDPEFMNSMSPFRAYLVISYGVAQSSMPSFSVVPEQDRWALAFYVMSLRYPRCDAEVPQWTLSELSKSTDNDLVARRGEPAVACLRRIAPHDPAKTAGSASDVKGARAFPRTPKAPGHPQ